MAVNLSFFIATGRPLNVALYTSEKPPVANGVVAHLTALDGRTNEGGRISKVPHNLRRDLRCWPRFCWER